MKKILTSWNIQFMLWIAVIVLMGAVLTLFGEDKGTNEHYMFIPLVSWILVGIGFFIIRLTTKKRK